MLNRSSWYLFKALILSLFLVSSCHDPNTDIAHELWQTDAQGQVLKISGMRCQACAKKIEKKLLEIRGVSRAIINFDQGLLKVTFDENVVTIDTIKDTITAMGFTVSE